MARTWHWLNAVRRMFANSSCKSVAILDHTSLIHTAPLEEETAISAAPAASTSQTARFEGENDRKTYRKVVLTIEDVAAIKIQACFRGHLARRAFQALRSLVKLQALVRGVCVRRQARIAVRCMQTMVRLQVRIRARQLLRSSGDMDLNVH